ncbi:metalloregulator ArsR/SmtB family transcription factor [Halobacillus sp. ACCC02827]|uniref:DUF2087 domain-containing protein n=1 Tax=Bacillaceae TaxID=186817 RepID=UPI0002A4F0AE|nr:MULTISPECIES: metalloregulator ArsR/SmtB family transcription factor [Bacillaceae]ELK46063.1 ArsR family transcriptional regulator [Halobacillus sp. BAB-2008]QHT46283.1 metalloregulator ArsR/SmtB family transcription factor [Bacillus sp. SB49]WJE17105.1 metalloregulator ArsR/SmtB family transcription factor [Halobacillus sp. ACCC02827]
MQLDKMVHFHKAVGDPTRLRIIAMLRQGPLHGQAIAGKLGLKPPTITHHLKKLKDTGMVYARRDKNTVYFHLDEERLKMMSTAILRIGDDSGWKAQELHVDDSDQRKIIRSFITIDGKLKHLPSQLKKKNVVLSYFVKGLKQGEVYEEKDINAYIRTFFDDPATLRREWVMQQFVYRENGKYERNPEAMWPVVVPDHIG